MTLDYPAIIETEAQHIVAAYEAAPAGKVPWADHWSVGTVARHVAGTHHVVAEIIERRPDADFGLFATLDAPAKNAPEFPAWSTGSTAALTRQLREVDGTEQCWDWYHASGGTVAFWGRRMAHEATVHRWDAEAGAGGDIAPIDPSVASDGIDEYLGVFVDATRRGANAPAGPTIRIEATDTDDDWYLELPAGDRVVHRGQRDHGLHLRGSSEGLLLFIWGRRGIDAAEIEVDGDRSVLDRWAELLPPM
jgi:uncharacterized protein (TIGR03083 family)